MQTSRRNETDTAETEMTPPTQFRFELDSWGHEYLTVVLRAGKFTCRAGDWAARFAEPFVIQPTAAQWQECWDAVARARVWAWQPLYETDCLDGTSWSLKLAWNGQRIVSQGRNAYPGGHETEYAPDSEFGIFETAVRKLVGNQKQQ
jgi:hypothetical protein